MSLISYNGLLDLVKDKVITADPENINGASIDITLDSTILIESPKGSIVDLAAKETLNMQAITLPLNGYGLNPYEFVLASSNEVFNLPDNIACEYKLKSSLARCGLNHMLAGWCDPLWTNSKLTLEFINSSKHHRLLLRTNMKIGQMVFFETDPVPHENSYAVKGQYNNQKQATASKGLR